MSATHIKDLKKRLIQIGLRHPGGVFSDASMMATWIDDTKYFMFVESKVDFLGLLEYTVFPPSTTKNEEFQVCVMPTPRGLIFVWRVFDTPKNREDFLLTLEHFYGQKIPLEKRLTYIDTIDMRVRKFLGAIVECQLTPKGEV